MNNQVGIQKILSGVQKYQWGMKGSNPQCLVYKYKKNEHSGYDQTPLNEDDQYAELWMGTHTLLPSIVADTRQSLGSFSTIPYLFKVLSVEKALSIQAHPNKQQAEILHVREPKIYVDDNHKPEMTISLDDFQALSGLCIKEEIIMNVELNPLLIDAIGPQLWSDFKLSQDVSALLKEIILKILSLDQHEVTKICEIIQFPQSECDAIHNLKDQYPNDVGIIFVLFLNHVRLQAGEALVMEAGILHAYLKGNCLECMANSDNVVRAGLTPKLKDKKTLAEIMILKMGPVEKVIPLIIEETNKVKVSQYITSYKEFSCIHVNVHHEGQTQEITLTNQSILICTKGSGVIQQGDLLQEIKEGQTYYVQENQRIAFRSQINLDIFICTSL